MPRYLPKIENKKDEEFSNISLCQNRTNYSHRIQKISKELFSVLNVIEINTASNKFNFAIVILDCICKSLL